MIVEIARVRKNREANLMKVGGTGDPPSLLASGIQGGQQHRRKQDDDGDDHQQLDEGEGGKLLRCGSLHWDSSRTTLYIHPGGGFVNEERRRGSTGGTPVQHGATGNGRDARSTRYWK